MNIDTNFDRKDILVIILVLLVTVVGAAFISSMNTERTASQDVAMFTCPAANVNLLGMALEQKDARYCGCHTDTEKTAMCETSITDAAAFKRAVSRRDIEMCADVSDTTRAAACESIIKQNPDYIGHRICPEVACNATIEGKVTAIEGNTITLEPEVFIGESLDPGELEAVDLELLNNTEVQQYSHTLGDFAVDETSVSVGDSIGVTLSEDDQVEAVVIFIN